MDDDLGEIADFLGIEEQKAEKLSMVENRTVRLDLKPCEISRLLCSEGESLNTPRLSTTRGRFCLATSASEGMSSRSAV
jgi:hypothetical protein